MGQKVPVKLCFSVDPFCQSLILQTKARLLQCVSWAFGETTCRLIYAMSMSSLLSLSELFLLVLLNFIQRATKYLISKLFEGRWRVVHAINRMLQISLCTGLLGLQFLHFLLNSKDINNWRSFRTGLSVINRDPGTSTKTAAEIWTSRFPFSFLYNTFVSI